MKVIIVLALLAYSVESRKVIEKCDGVIDVNNAEEEVLKNNIGSPYQLAIDRDKDTLFFSYTREEKGESIFELAFINLTNSEFKTVNGIVGGFANAVDEKSHTVYLGGENGIYTFDYKSNFANHVDGTNHRVWQMFFKKYLYYTTYPEEELYVLKNGQTQRVSQLNNTRAMLVAVDNFGNIFFSNSSGLYIYEEQKEKPNSITHMGDYIINSFTSDVQGNLYFSTPNSIYTIGSNKSVKQLIVLDDVYGFAIEQNGSLIYSTEDSIIRLKLNTKQC
ncbi:ommochrome-binding protein [Bicyclus anynana]|uniref:Ommochrome-binding protein n=1 Tax=Bicyclus anynana TaxID=110368 RepID=A0A6J1NML6_BICAN|nr:ommochrome-binding protein [Bicyclus anynana]